MRWLERIYSAITAVERKFPLMSSMAHASVFALLAAAPGLSVAQAFPVKPIRIVTAEAGGGADFFARLIALGITPKLGQQVIVENRGGSTIIPAMLVIKGAPDGHLLIMYGNGVWMTPVLQKDVPYDAINDFSPVTLAVSSPNILVVHPSLPARSVKELIAHAKAHPGQLNFGSSSAGAGNRLAAELFKVMAGVDIAHVPYKGAGPALNGLIAGDIQLMFGAAAAVKPHVATGKLRALAITSAQASRLSDLPTVAAAGVPNYQSVVNYGVLGPARMPAAIVNRLQQEIAAAINAKELREKIYTAGAEPVGNTPDEFAQAIKDELNVMGKVIRDAGISGS